jgi:hypothetical protein
VLVSGAANNHISRLLWHRPKGRKWLAGGEPVSGSADNLMHPDLWHTSPARKSRINGFPLP